MANLDLLFAGMEVVETHLFRVTRDADLAIEEDEADDLLLAIEEELLRRRFGEAVRLEVERSMPAETREILLKGIGLEADRDVALGHLLGPDERPHPPGGAEGLHPGVILRREELEGTQHAPGGEELGDGAIGGHLTHQRIRKC